MGHLRAVTSFLPNASSLLVRLFSRNGCGRHLSAIFGIALLFVGATSRSLAAVHRTNPQIQQGLVGSFTATGSQVPTFGPGWQVLNSASTEVGSNSNPRSWLVTYSQSSNSLTVTVPAAASVATNYSARYFVGGAPHSGSFDVISGSTQVPPLAPTNVVGIGTDSAANLTWSASANATGYYVQRSYFPGGPYQLTFPNTTQTKYTDSNGVTNGIAYYYEVVAYNAYGSSPSSAEVAVIPNISVPHFEPSKLTITLAGNTVTTFSAINASPQGDTTTHSTQNGIVYYVETQSGYFMTGVTAVSPSTEQTFPMQFTDDTDPNNPVPVIANGLFIVSGFQPVQAGANVGDIYLVQGSASRTYHIVSGVQVIDIPWYASVTMTQHAKYRLQSSNASTVSLDSRMAFGQPNTDGELPGDPNAEPANVLFNGYLFRGGLFAGNTPMGGTDLSGTARIQVNVSNFSGLHQPVWSALCLVYTGMPTAFTNAMTLTLSLPDPSDANLAVPFAQVNWANRWNLGIAAPRSNFTFDSNTPVTEYACFQNPGLSQNMLIALQNETTLINNKVGCWRYFANNGYSIPAAPPVLIVLDCLLNTLSH